jgi:N-methylhydantoinase A
LHSLCAACTLCAIVRTNADPATWGSAVGFAVGVDIGGTFTDVSMVAEDGNVYTAKSPSTPKDLTEGLLDALRLVADQVGLSLAELLERTDKFAHGTTQTSNVIFTWVGATVGLITTQGFADELLIMRARGRVAGLGLAHRRHLRATDKPPQIVPRHRIVEIAERVDRTGAVLVAARRVDIEAAVRSLLDQGVDSIAICLLWAQENPQHELLVESVVHDLAPNIHVSLSHQLAPVVGEYERAATAVVNAFVAPTVDTYLHQLEARLRDLRLRTPLLVLQSSGGVMTVRDTVPIHTIESGPAAGMVAVRELSAELDAPNIVATDVGGTTFKVGLLVDREWGFSKETIINQYSLILPMIDLVSIGAGGGSIAWADDGRLRVGPQSAGADPGPACYAWGGTEPTVTDADLVLGFLNPDRFLSGRFPLHRDLAERAIKRHVADPIFGGDVVAAAAAIRRVVDAQMADLVRKTTIERGYDARNFTMVAYGGAGPLHAADYGQHIGINTIVVPHSATAYSAYGAAISDIGKFAQRSVPRSFLTNNARLEVAYEHLEAESRDLVTRQSLHAEDISVVRWADMRYERQLHDVRVNPRGEADGHPVAERLTDAFISRYRELYGSQAVLARARPVLLRIGVEVTGRIERPPLAPMPLSGPEPSGGLAGPRRMFWPDSGTWIATPTFDSMRLAAGNRVAGRAVIEQPGTTILIPAGWEAEIDRLGNTILRCRRSTEAVTAGLPGGFG